MLPRFFVPQALSPGATVELPPAAAHHAIRVLRLGDGEPVVLFNGGGGEWRAALTRGGPGLRAVLESHDAADKVPGLHVTLVQGLPAADKMDWVVQKCTELGVAAIVPVAARRSVVRLVGERKSRREAHWRQVAVAACEQCGRNRVPEVAPLLELPHYLGQPAAENEQRYLLAPGGTGRLSERPRPPGSVVLLTGPEGGFEEGEIRAALAAGFMPLTLGPRVLRTETAGVAALAAMMSLWGDL